MSTTYLTITDSDSSNTDANFYYLLGFQPSLGAMIFSDDTLQIFLDARYAQMSENIDEIHVKTILENPQLEIKYHQTQHFIDDITHALTDISVIACNPNIAFAYIAEIEKKCPNIHIVQNMNFLQDKRVRKSDQEREKLKKVIEITDQVYLSIEAYKHAGKLEDMTEKELKNNIQQKNFELGADAESFTPIVAFGPNSAVPHHSSDTTRIATGPLLIDMGVQYAGYCSDFTRTFWVGEKNTLYNEYMEVWSIVKGAYEYARDSFELGMTGKDLDALARGFISQAGYGEYFTHSLGHGIGLQIHEAPKISQTSDDILEEQMVFTIEPGIYLPGKFGVRLENIVFVESGKLVEYSQIPFSI